MRKKSKSENGGDNYVFMDLKVNMDYDNPVKFVLDTIQQ